MSYILDALRRAEAERERGAVPGLHAQPYQPSAEAAGAAQPARRPVWLVVGVLLALVVALLAYALWPATPAPVAATGGAPAAPAAALSLPPSRQSPPRPVEPSPSATPQPQPAATPQPETAVTPQPAAATPERRPPVAEPPKPAYIDAPPPEPRPQPRKPPEPAAVEARVPSIAELPEAVRRELPKLTLGGAMYSETPSARMLIVNGQVLREKERLTPELVLEQIRLKSAVFAYKGYRYELAY